jgi:membrane protease YdiL (CAAX protease family)
MKHHMPTPGDFGEAEPAAVEARSFDAGREDHMIRVAPGTLLIVHAVLAALLQVGWTLLPDGTFGLDKVSLRGYALAAALMQGLCILLPTLVIAAGYRVTPRMLLGRSLPRPGGIILAAAAGIPAAVLLTGLNNVAIYFLAKSGFTFPAPSALRIAADGPESWTVVLILAVIVPGIVEELMFRGLIQGAMEHSGARLSAILLPALAFALFHADPLFLLAPLGAGLLLGYLRASTGSVFAAVVAHVSLNLTLVAIRPLLPQWRDVAMGGAFDADALLTVSIVASIVALVAAVPVLLAFSSTMFRRSTAPIRPFGTQPEPRVFLEWRFLLGCGLLGIFLVALYSFSLSLG